LLCQSVSEPCRASDQSKRTSLTACLLYDVLTLVP